MSIALYIPSHNDSQLVVESLRSCEAWPRIIIADNASDPAHARELESLADHRNHGNRVTVFHHERNLGRVGNWVWCVDHFLKSGAQWIKFLCAGDRQTPESFAAFERAISEHHGQWRTRYIIGQVEHVWKHGQRNLWYENAELSRVPPFECMRLAAMNGNVFHSLGAGIVHRDALTEGYEFADGLLSFCADFWFALGIGRRHGFTFIPQTCLQVVFENRKTLTAKIGSLEAVAEEALVRYRAAEYFGELTADYGTRGQLMRAVRDWTAEMMKGA